MGNSEANGRTRGGLAYRDLGLPEGEPTPNSRGTGHVLGGARLPILICLPQFFGNTKPSGEPDTPNGTSVNHRQLLVCLLANRRTVGGGRVPILVLSSPERPAERECKVFGPTRDGSFGNDGPLGNRTMRVMSKRTARSKEIMGGRCDRIVVYSDKRRRRLKVSVCAVASNPRREKTMDRLSPREQSGTQL